MQQYTSEEALNGIFNILDTTIKEYNKNRSENKTESSHVIEQLMAGLGASAPRGTNLGDAVKQLSEGMSILKENGITARDADAVAEIISSLGRALGSIKVEPADVKALSSVVQALGVLGSLDEDILEKLSGFKDADAVAEIISSLGRALGSIKVEPADVESIQTVMSTLQQLLVILDKTSLSFSTLFMPLKGRIIGKSMAAFFKEIVAAIPREEIEVHIQGIGELFTSMLPLLDKNSQYSITRMLLIMNEENGIKIGKFFAGLIAGIPEEKKMRETIQSVHDLLKIVTDMTLSKYLKVRMILTEKNGQRIGAFFKAIIDPIEKDKDKFPDLMPITKFLESLAGIGILGAAALALLRPILTPKFGASIAGFITKLVEPLDDEKMARIKGFTDAMKTLSMGILILTGSIALLAGTITLFGAMTVIGSVVVSTFYIGAVLGLMRLLVKSGDEVKEGIRSLNDISKVMVIMTAQIIALSIMGMYMEKLDWESIGKIVAVTVIVGGLMTWALVAGQKWQRGGENAQKAMIGVSVLLISAVAALTIVTWVAKENTLGDLALGMTMLALVFVGTYFIVDKILSKANKKFEKALENIWQIVAIMGVTSLLLNFLVAPLGDIWDQTLVGIALVTVAVGAMASIVWVLAKVNKENLDAATTAMAAMTLIMGAVSALALLVFPKIYEQWDIIALGGAEVLAIIGIMALTVGLLAKVKEKDLKSATHAILSMTLMFGVVSLIAATLLIPIGQNWDAVFGGFFVIGSIIAMMICATYALALIDHKNIDAAADAILAMTLMVTAVSLISYLLFIPIGKRWDEILPGALIVMGIIGALTLMVWGLSKVDADNLRQATITMVVMTALVLGVSLIALELFIPLAHQWDSVLIGAALVLGTIFIMGLIVRKLSKIDRKDLLSSIIAIAGIALGLLGISLIINELIIPIGYEWEAAALGSAVVLATIGVFGLIVWGLSKIPLESLGVGLLAMAGIEAIMYTLGFAMPPYMEVCKMMYEHAGEIALGGLELVATLTVWGAILAAVGYFAEFTWVIAVGAALVEPVALLLWQLGETMPSYIKMCMLMHENITDVTLGRLELAATLTAWSVLFLMIAGMSGPVLLAMPAMALIQGTLYALTKIMPGYINTMKLVYSSKDALTQGGKIMGDAIEDMGWLMGKIGLIFGNPLGAVAITLGLAVIGEVAVGMKALNWVVRSYASISNELKRAELDLARVQEVKNIFTADGGLVDAIEDIVGRMADVGLWASAKAAVIARTIRHIFGTISDFTRVIVEALNMKYVDEWDENGKPKSYMKVTPAMYMEAGVLISAAFGYFLKELGAGMEAMKDVSATTLAAMGFAIRPVMTAVRDFTDSIIKVLSAAIPEAFDENGKPIKYRKFEKREFKDAAITISDAFGEFLKTLGPKLKELGPYAVQLMNGLAKGIGPVIEAVVKFTDMVTGFIVGKDYTYTDENGKRVTKHVNINQDEFVAAGNKIANAFVGFIDTIYKAFDKEGYNKTHWFSDDEVGGKLIELIDGLKNIGIVIDNVNKFVNVIVDASEKTVKIDLRAKGIMLATALTSFIDQLALNLAAEGKAEQVEALVSTMKDVTKLIKQLDNAINAAIKIFNDRGAVMKEMIAQQTTDDLFTILTSFVRPDAMESLKQLNVRDVARLVPYFKKMNETVKLLIKMTDINKDGIDVPTAVDTFLGVIAKFDDFKMPDIHEMAPMPNYMKYVVKTARLMNELDEEMQNVQITESITQFLRDIDLLTQRELSSRSQRSRRAMILFGNDLKKFTRQVVGTKQQIVVFTAKVNNAADALKKFDDAILAREKQRNDSLKKFADLVKEIADNMDTLQGRINTLDETKIMQNFTGIGRLFRMVLGEGENNAQNNTAQQQQTQNTSRQTQQNQRGQQNVNNTNVYNQQSRTSQKQMVNFYFADTHFSGFMETKNV